MIRVLIVDDEPIAVTAHVDYLSRIEGFELAGTASTIGEAQHALGAARASGLGIDLVLLDLTLPDAHGLDLARSLRTARMDVDFIAITAVRQTETVQAALAVGAVQYLIKPFGFATFRDKLEQYADYRARLIDARGIYSQAQIDDLLSSRSPAGRTSLPKGLTEVTLTAVSAHLEGASDQASASEVGASLALSRVTARRYLEHLADLGLATRTQRYGTPGRPEVEYAWRR